eukprot:1702477-Rhodomonas_salina.1
MQSCGGGVRFPSAHTSTSPKAWRPHTTKSSCAIETRGGLSEGVDCSGKRLGIPTGRVRWGFEILWVFPQGKCVP